MFIRLAVLTDATQISRLMEQLGYSIGADDLRKKLENFGTSEIDAVFVAESEDKIIGFISCHITPCFHQNPPVGRITSLVLDEDSRRRGIGSSLVKEADAFFQKNGCERAEVTSGDHRSDAHGFYQSQGYEIDERRFVKKYS